MEIIVQTLNLVPFEPASVEYGLETNAEPHENPPLCAAFGNGRRLVVKPGSGGTGTAGIMKKRNFEDSIKAPGGLLLVTGMALAPQISVQPAQILHESGLTG